MEEKEGTAGINGDGKNKKKIITSKMCFKGKYSINNKRKCQLETLE